MIAELRQAWRMILKSPLLAGVVILSLGVGIGANTVVFSWIEAVIFKPIPEVRDAGSFHLVEPRTDTGIYIGSSWLEYRDLADRLQTMTDLLAFRMAPLYVGDSGKVERGNGLLVSGNYFSGLGLTPALGRLLRPEDVDHQVGQPVMVISYDYWRTRLGGSADVIGQSMRVNGQTLTIVGVAPEGFQGTILRLTFDIWLPAPLSPLLFTGSRELEDRSVRSYSIIGRLSPHASEASAQDEVAGVMRELARTFPKTNTTVQADVLSFWQAPRGPQRLLATSLVVLQGITLLLLLAVCGNTANLLLARASARRQEMAVRLALGAKPWRVAQLLLTESLVLALCGAALGAGMAVWGTRALNTLPQMRVRGIPISFQTNVDGTGLAVAMLLGIACAIVFGLAPALQLARVAPQHLRASSNTEPRSRVRNILMATEVALAVVVLLVAGLFFRNFNATRGVDPGFVRDGVLLAEYDLTGRPVDEAGMRRFAAMLLAKLRALPAVRGAAIASAVPLDIHGLPTRFISVEGRPRNEASPDQALANTVTPGYFEVMGIPLLQGKDFADLDDPAAPAQAIVNEEFVRRFLVGVQPLGRRVEARGRSYVIAAVARNSLYNGFGEPPLPIVYFSYRDRPGVIGEVHLRTRVGSETALAPDLRRIVRELDPELPIYDIRTLNDHIESNLIFRRVPARMFSVLGPLLLVLAATGIYAVVAYTVSQRTKEIGVRLALGATTRRVILEHVGESLVVVGVGALGGWMIAFFVAMVSSPEPVDAIVFSAVPSVLMLVACLACWLPARRAALVDPVVALRQD